MSRSRSRYKPKGPDPGGDDEGANVTVLYGQAGGLSGVTSDQDRFISYRHESHMNLLTDGSISFVVNRGSLNGGTSALTLFTSADGGGAYTNKLTRASTGQFTTSDVYFQDSDAGVYNLWVAYIDNSSPRRVMLQVWHRNGAGTWSSLVNEVVYSAAGIDADNPTIYVDGSAVAWIAFPTTAQSDNTHDIRLYRRTGAATYVDTTQHFYGSAGATTRLPVLGTGRSVRLIGLPSGIGCMYTVQGEYSWAVHVNGDPVNTWAEGVIYTNPYGDEDPYSSHFSLAPDPSGNILNAFVANRQLCVRKWTAGGGGWGNVKGLTSPIQATYTQAAVLADGTYVAMTNDSHAYALIFKSTDAGATWVHSHTLRHPAVDANTSYPNPRLETFVTGAASIEALIKATVMQYTNTGVESLMTAWA